jgi:hypothetical protein
MPRIQDRSRRGSRSSPVSLLFFLAVMVMVGATSDVASSDALLVAAAASRFRSWRTIDHVSVWRSPARPRGLTPVEHLRG